MGRWDGLEIDAAWSQMIEFESITLGTESVFIIDNLSDPGRKKPVLLNFRKSFNQTKRYMVQNTRRFFLKYAGAVFQLHKFIRRNILAAHQISNDTFVLLCCILFTFSSEHCYIGLQVSVHRVYE